MISWKENISTQEWDSILTSMKGHPLQSAKWGKSRKLAEGINDVRWAAFEESKPVYLVRFELRYFLKIIKIAWIPKGPVSYKSTSLDKLQQAFLKRLKEKGFFICFMNPWNKIESGKENQSDLFTIWIDLTKEKNELWNNLHKQFRYGVRRSEKQGVIIEKTSSYTEVLKFYSICQTLSQRKNFSLCTSINLMNELLEKDDKDEVEAVLFVAKHNDQTCGGAFILRCGENLHYMWGAVDRQFANLSIGEALQWKVIEWGLDINCKKYDLEGVVKDCKSGTDYFKKKMGGEIIAYSGIQTFYLNTLTKLISILSKPILNSPFLLEKFKKFFFFTNQLK